MLARTLHLICLNTFNGKINQHVYTYTCIRFCRIFPSVFRDTSPFVVQRDTEMLVMQWIYKLFVAYINTCKKIVSKYSYLFSGVVLF